MNSKTMLDVMLALSLSELPTCFICTVACQSFVGFYVALRCLSAFARYCTFFFMYKTTLHAQCCLARICMCHYLMFISTLFKPLRTTKLT